MTALFFILIFFVGLVICFTNVGILLWAQFPDFAIADWFMAGVTLTIALLFASVWNKRSEVKGDDNGLTG